jgi:integrase
MAKKTQLKSKGSSSRASPISAVVLSTQQGESLIANMKTNAKSRKTLRVQNRKNVITPIPKQMTSLEAASVSKQSLCRYTSYWEWMKPVLLNKKQKLKPVHMVDRLLSEKLDQLFHDGEDISMGQYLVAAIVFFNHSLKSQNMSALPRVRQCLKGWRKVAPQRSRLPVPWEVTCLLVETALSNQLCSIAIHLLLMFTLYLRPSEALRIRACDVIRPSRGRGAAFKLWGFVLHPEEVGIPSKTQDFDETLQLDLEYHKGIGEAINRYMIKNRIHGNQVILSHTNSDVNQFLEEQLTALNLQKLGHMHAYRFRHGGASHDYVNKFRQLASVQQRGRWKSMNSTRRYQKGGRLAQIFQALPSDVQQRCVAATDAIQATLQRGL